MEFTFQLHNFVYNINVSMYVIIHELSHIINF
jgi:hypothetical protein